MTVRDPSAASIDRSPEVTPGATLVFDAEGRVVDANGRCEPVFGRDLEALRGQTVADLVAAGHLSAADAETCRAAVDAVADGDPVRRFRVEIAPLGTAESYVYEVSVRPRGDAPLGEAGLGAHDGGGADPGADPGTGAGAGGADDDGADGSDDDSGGCDGDGDCEDAGGRAAGTRWSLRNVGPDRDYGETVESLHRATQELMDAGGRREVLARAATAANEVLGFPGTGVREYDPRYDLLRHVGFGGRVGHVDSRPPFPVEDSPHGEAFRTGETVVETVEPGDSYDRGAFTQTMYVPIGEEGVLSLGTVGRPFDEEDRRLAELLAENTAAALELVDRNESLREERERLRLLKRVLVRVMRHNARNDLQVVRGAVQRIGARAEDDRTAELAAMAVDTVDDFLETGEKARRIGRVLDEGQDAAELDAVVAAEDVVDWARRRFPGATVEADLPRQAWVRAHSDLPVALRNLVENAVVHHHEHDGDADGARRGGGRAGGVGRGGDGGDADPGGDAGDGDGPTVRVVVDRHPSWVDVRVVDDGPGIDEAEVAAVERPGERAVDVEHGSGAGLWLVNWIVVASDGDLLFDVDDRGTTATVRLQPATGGVGD